VTFVRNTSLTIRFLLTILIELTLIVTSAEINLKTSTIQLTPVSKPILLGVIVSVLMKHARRSVM